MKQKKNFIGGKIKGYVMEDEHSMDIDNLFDFKITKLVVEEKNRNRLF